MGPCGIAYTFVACSLIELINLPVESSLCLELAAMLPLTNRVKRLPFVSLNDSWVTYLKREASGSRLVVHNTDGRNECENPGHP